jgi:hypothetical protein
MLHAFMLSLVILMREGHHTECGYTEYSYAECLYAEYHMLVRLVSLC